MTGDLRGLAARLNAINNGRGDCNDRCYGEPCIHQRTVHDPRCNDSCVDGTHALLAVDVQTGTPIDPLVRIERRLAEEHAAAPADGTLWHRGARAAFARAIDIVREATTA